jgi:hypothetical protein
MSGKIALAAGFADLSGARTLRRFFLKILLQFQRFL